MNIDESLEVKYDSDLDSTIKYLENAKERGENVYIDFKSEHGLIRLYSADINSDTAYQRIYGLTKEEKNNYEEELKTSNNINEVHAKYQNMIAVYFDLLRDDSKKLDFKGKSIYELLKTLNECKKLNKNIYIDYNSEKMDIPIRFYSMDLDIDREFLSVMGLSKPQYDEYKEKLIVRNDKELKSAITNIYDEINNK